MSHNFYTIQIGSNWYMVTGVHDLEVTYGAKIYQIDLYVLC